MLQNAKKSTGWRKRILKFKKILEDLRRLNIFSWYNEIENMFSIVIIFNLSHRTFASFIFKIISTNLTVFWYKLISPCVIYSPKIVCFRFCFAPYLSTTHCFIANAHLFLHQPSFAITIANLINIAQKIHSLKIRLLILSKHINNS